MKISIRIALSRVIRGLTRLACAWMTSTTQLASTKTVHPHAQDRKPNIAPRAMQEAFTHLTQAQDATVLTKRLLLDETRSLLSE